MMHLNPRSVLRPEYLDHSRNNPNLNIRLNEGSIKRVNTNTAPVYWLETPPKNRKRHTIRRLCHPYVRQDRNYISTATNCNSEHVEIKRAPSTIPSRSDTSDSDELSPDNSSSPCLSYTSRYSSDSTGYNYDNKSNFRNISNSIREDISNQTKTYTHGQAEQLRRSRESTTFALIDAQLSMPPLNQVRDMYLQNRNGCGSGCSSSAARTTKKANLSVVHTVVRFRVKEYLIELRDHIRRSLDTLFYSLFADYDTKSRDSLASEIIGLSSLPCSANCQFCPDLFQRPDRTRSNFRTDSGRSRVPYNTQTEYREMLQTPYTSQTMKKYTTRSSPPSPILNSDSLVDSSNTALKIAEVKPEFDCQTRTPASSLEATQGCEINDNCIGQFSTKLFPSTCGISLTNPLLERPLPSYHINMFEPKSLKRVRLDSTSLRLVNDFDNVDWSAEDIDFGPCGEELVDLHNLVTDTNPELHSVKYDEPIFDPAYDLGDLLHQFTSDSYPNLQLAISP